MVAIPNIITTKRAMSLRACIQGTVDFMEMWVLGQGNTGDHLHFITAMCLMYLKDRARSVADPGFPIGGIDQVGGHRPQIRAPFGENICQNERTGSHGGCVPGMPARSAYVNASMVGIRLPPNLQTVKCWKWG